MPAVSPPKWHLAHTTWFFETFLLKPYLANYQVFHSAYEYLFNSYYNGVGQPFPRNSRGNLSRPTVSEVYAYREQVDEAMDALIRNKGLDNFDEVQQRIVVGLHHEQQHQELLVTDIKHILGTNPLQPVYEEIAEKCPQNETDLVFHEFSGGLGIVGNKSGEFAFDNESPQHEVLLQPFQLANRLTTNGEYLEFIEAGGYENFEYWLSDGWSWVQENEISAPLYWSHNEDRRAEYHLSGVAQLNMDLPLTHISHFEADAFARFSDARLPTEFEWQVAAENVPVSGNFVESRIFHPRSAAEHENGHTLSQLYGDCWEWTASPYTAFPGYQPLPGALGEYNGKFMNNQMVLKGGSCASPQNHLRASYRNFFYPEERWQFTGIRLARNV